MKGLLHKFNRRAKRGAMSMSAAAVFTVGGAGVAHAAPPQETAALHETVSSQTQVRTQAQDYAYSQERLDVIKARMARTQEGAALLQFAADENIRIEMSSSAVMDSNLKDKTLVKGVNYSTLIRLNGDVAGDDFILITLAHEIRHSWHERALGSDDMPFTPQQELLKRRIQEADAFAYEIHFAYEYEKATGTRLNIGQTYPCEGENAYACLLSDYRGWRKDRNKTLEDAYTKLLEKTLKHVHRQGYDTRLLRIVDTGWGAVANAAERGVNWATLLEDPATDAAFAAHMRKVATVGLSPGTDPAALSRWSDDDFLSLRKTGGKLSRGDRRALGALQEKFADARLAWQEFKAKEETPRGTAIAPPASPGAI